MITITSLSHSLLYQELIQEVDLVMVVEVILLLKVKDLEMILILSVNLITLNIHPYQLLGIKLDVLCQKQQLAIDSLVMYHLQLLQMERIGITLQEDSNIILNQQQKIYSLNKDLIKVLVLLTSMEMDSEMTIVQQNQVVKLEILLEKHSLYHLSNLNV